MDLFLNKVISWRAEDRQAGAIESTADSTGRNSTLSDDESVHAETSSVKRNNYLVVVSESHNASAAPAAPAAPAPPTPARFRRSVALASRAAEFRKAKAARKKAKSVAKVATECVPTLQSPVCIQPKSTTALNDSKPTENGANNYYSSLVLSESKLDQPHLRKEQLEQLLTSYSTLDERTEVSTAESSPRNSWDDISNNTECKAAEDEVQRNQISKDEQHKPDDFCVCICEESNEEKENIGKECIRGQLAKDMRLTCEDNVVYKSAKEVTADDDDDDQSIDILQENGSDEEGDHDVFALASLGTEPSKNDEASNIMVVLKEETIHNVEATENQEVKQDHAPVSPVTSVDGQRPAYERKTEVNNKASNEEVAVEEESTYNIVTTENQEAEQEVRHEVKHEVKQDDAPASPVNCINERRPVYDRKVEVRDEASNEEVTAEEGSTYSVVTENQEVKLDNVLMYDRKIEVNDEASNEAVAVKEESVYVSETAENEEVKQDKTPKSPVTNVNEHTTPYHIKIDVFGDGSLQSCDSVFQKISPIKNERASDILGEGVLQSRDEVDKRTKDIEKEDISACHEMQRLDRKEKAFQNKYDRPLDDLTTSFVTIKERDREERGNVTPSKDDSTSLSSDSKMFCTPRICFIMEDDGDATSNQNMNVSSDDRRAPSNVIPARRSLKRQDSGSMRSVSQDASGAHGRSRNNTRTSSDSLPLRSNHSRSRSADHPREERGSSKLRDGHITEQSSRCRSRPPCDDSKEGFSGLTKPSRSLSGDASRGPTYPKSKQGIMDFNSSRPALSYEMDRHGKAVPAEPNHKRSRSNDPPRKEQNLSPTLLDQAKPSRPRRPRPKSCISSNDCSHLARLSRSLSGDGVRNSENVLNTRCVDDLNLARPAHTHEHNRRGQVVSSKPSRTRSRSSDPLLKRQGLSPVSIEKSMPSRPRRPRPKSCVSINDYSHLASLNKALSGHDARNSMKAAQKQSVEDFNSSCPVLSYEVNAQGEAVPSRPNYIHSTDSLLKRHNLSPASLDATRPSRPRRTRSHSTVSTNDRSHLVRLSRTLSENKGRSSENTSKKENSHDLDSSCPVLSYEFDMQEESFSTGSNHRRPVLERSGRCYSVSSRSLCDVPASSSRDSSQASDGRRLSRTSSKIEEDNRSSFKRHGRSVSCRSFSDEGSKDKRRSASIDAVSRNYDRPSHGRIRKCPSSASLSEGISSRDQTRDLDNKIRDEGARSSNRPLGRGCGRSSSSQSLEDVLSSSRDNRRSEKMRVSRSSSSRSLMDPRDYRSFSPSSASLMVDSRHKIPSSSSHSQTSRHSEVRGKSNSSSKDESRRSFDSSSVNETTKSRNAKSGSASSSDTMRKGSSERPMRDHSRISPPNHERHSSRRSTCLDPRMGLSKTIH